MKESLLKIEFDLDEPILNDDYTVYEGFYYIADGKVIVSYINGSVLDLKHSMNYKEVRRCDMCRRNL